jgi:hypothetical protein
MRDHRHYVVRWHMANRRRHNTTGRVNKISRYVAMSHWLMKTPAWHSLDCVSRCAYIELASRYAGPGSNNGRIPYSLREMAEALGCSKATAMRAMERLQNRGFLVMTKQGAFSVKVRSATEWRLTEFGCDVTGELATKDFARWEPKNKTRFQTETHTGVEMKPNGCRDETTPPSKTPLRFHDDTREDVSRFHQRDTSSLPGHSDSGTTTLSGAMTDIAAGVSAAVLNSPLARGGARPIGSQRDPAPAREHDLVAALEARKQRAGFTRLVQR